MPKDYAKYSNRSERKLVSQGWHYRLLWAILLLSLLSLVFYVWYANKTQRPLFPVLSHWVSEVKSITTTTPSAPVTPKPRAALEIPFENEVQFHFYNDLPNMKVISSQPKLPKPVELKMQHRLELGRFTNQNTASDKRISLLLAGFEVDLIKNTQSGKTFYVLQQGPFATLAVAKSEQSKLKQKGFLSDIVSTPKKDN